jgi:hypothetical protein
MLLLLLRLLTAPASIFPTAAAMETVTQPQAAHVDGASLADARARQAEIEAGPAKIRALTRVANDTQYRASCVAQRLAEAQAHVALARDEMQRLTNPAGLSAGDRAHALRRLTLIAERTREVEQAAHLCVDAEESSITATRSDTGVPPPIQRRGEVTLPPPMPYPCPGSVCTVITVP